jgi:hypothetical protein
MMVGEGIIHGRGRAAQAARVIEELVAKTEHDKKRQALVAY